MVEQVFPHSLWRGGVGEQPLAKAKPPQRSTGSLAETEDNRQPQQGAAGGS